MIKSALNYFNYSAGTGGRESNDFVGQTVELGSYRLYVKRVIAEGGFAFVFEAQDQEGQDYALKRLLAADKEASNTILQEICFLKKLSGHPNLIRFVQAASVEAEHGRMEYLLLTELCKGGELIDFMKGQKIPWPKEEILQIFFQTSRAVQHMHSQKPCIIHRDLKVENLLFDSQGMIKLCDLGSATTETFYPDESWTATQRSQVEDKITPHTTPMYRSPEILDLYQNFPIDSRMDIWALGCMLYYLCYFVHPFEDSAKLRIINGKYNIPENDSKCSVYHDLIFGMLQVDPRNRPNVDEIIQRLEEIGEALKVPLPASLRWACRPHSPHTRPTGLPQNSTPVGPGPGRPPPPRPQQPPIPPTRSQENVPPGPGSGNLLGSIKGHAGSLFKSIKDTSSKVVETVQATINKASELDLSYLTSRLVVMSYPAEGIEAAYRNNIDDVRLFMDSRHPGSYAVYNLSTRLYRPDKFANRVSDCGWSGRSCPSLHAIFAICKNMHLFFRQNPSNICVLHCLDGKSNSALIACAMLIFCRLFDSPESALRFFNSRRCPPDLDFSHFRYLGYVAALTSDSPIRVHNRQVRILGINIHPVPLFNRVKSGCTPFVEIQVGEQRVFSTSDEYENLRSYTCHDGAVSIPIDIIARGDVTITVYHARSTLGAKVQGKLTSIRMFQLQFHTGFLDASLSELSFNKSELGTLDEERDKYPQGFSVTLQVSVSCDDEAIADPPPAFWMHNPRSAGPKILFATKDERVAVLKQFCQGERCIKLLRSDSSSDETTPQTSPRRTAQPPTRPPQPSQPPIRESTNETQAAPGQANPSFFASLDWGAQEQKRQEQMGTVSRATPSPSPKPSPQPSPRFNRAPVDAAEQAEWDAGIRVGTGTPPPDEDWENDESEEGGGVEVDDLLHLSTSVLAPGSDRNSLASENLLDVSGGGSSTTGSQNNIDLIFGGSEPPFSSHPAASNDPFAIFNQGGGGGSTGMTNGQSQPPLVNKHLGGGDLLGGWSDAIGGNVQHAASTSNLSAPPGMSRNISAPSFMAAPGLNGVNPSQQKQGNYDPFAGLGGFGGKEPAVATTQQQTQRPSSTTPMFGSSPNSGPAPGPWRPPATTPMSPQPGHANRPPPPSGGVNWGTGAPGSQQPAASKPKANRQDTFDDLLKSQGFSASKQSGSTTLASMKREEDIQDLTEDEIKIKDWTEGKQRNIRALICSLHSVLWEGADKWEAVNMSQLITAAQVKKFYRKACLAVHPDKLTGTPHEELARKLFTELNDAWNEFEKSGQPSLG